MPAKPLWVLVGGDTLLSREFRDLIAENKLPVRLEMCSGSETDSVLTRDEGELSLLDPLTPEALTGAAVVLLAGDKDSQNRTRKLAAQVGGPPVFIDLTGASEDAPAARLRAPLLQPGESAAPASVAVIPHPGALMLARLLSLVHPRFPLRRTIATVLQPVSAQGRAGVDELHKQAASLLSFQSMPKGVFDAQVSFNLLPRFGVEARANLGESELRLEKHLATLLGPLGVPLPSVRLLHAPVFHGFCAQVWMEFDARPNPPELEALLTQEGIDVRTAEVEPPSNLSVAGRSGITVGEIDLDHNHPGGLWVWIAADNLRLTVENAVLVAGLAAGGARA